MSAPARHHRRALPAAPARRGWCPGLSRPMPTGDGLLARVHPPRGRLTRDQAHAVAEGARRFGNGHLDLTARDSAFCPRALPLGAVYLLGERGEGPGLPAVRALSGPAGTVRFDVIGLTMAHGRLARIDHIKNAIT